jgi:hypothetical protein
MNIITASVLYAGAGPEWEREYYPDVLARVQARGVRR